MNNVIQLNADNCKNCYKCIRQCKIKSIAFLDGRAKIIDDECIVCGNCVLSCPQNAKYVRSDLAKVKKLLSLNRSVYISLAPSYVAWYDVAYPVLSAALKQLGFAGIEETAIGAHAVSTAYCKLMKRAEMPHIIATACPSLVLLVEKQYPKLIDYLAPVASPMIAHGTLIKKAYGESAHVVFVGPCYAKKQESDDPIAGGSVDAALTFTELDEWFKSEKIDLHRVQADGEATGLIDTSCRRYPEPSGILRTFCGENAVQGKYVKMAVDGLQDCTEALDAMMHGMEQPIFLEANICRGGCIAGPAFRLAGKNMLKAKTAMSDSALPQDAKASLSVKKDALHARSFVNRAPKQKKPTEQEIREILLKTGKASKRDELNCGGCGYATCRDKAIAVYYKKADVNMCLPFFRDRAESISNTVIEHSPNGIIAFDEHDLVLDMNPKAEALLLIAKKEQMGKPLAAFVGHAIFNLAKTTNSPCTDRIVSGGNTMEMTVTYIQDHHIFLLFLKDITEKQQQQQALSEIKVQTIETTQRVIDKQMRVAQEIASLLGETTAETKVALTNLKKMQMEE